MAKFSFFLILLLLSTLSQQVSTASNDDPLDFIAISNALSSKGYNEMSLTLQMTLRDLLSTKPIHNTKVTIFCPTDKAFYSMKYPHAPFTLLQYQIALSGLHKHTLETSLSHGSKVDTLLHGHPLVVTTTSGTTTNASINEVKVVEWDIYNDGHVILHGVEDFFDPAFQILKYPWYDDDDGVVTNIDQDGYDLGTESLACQLVLLMFVYAALVVLAWYMSHVCSGHRRDDVCVYIDCV